MSSSPRILVAGIGNIFLGDDAFGVEAVTRLSQLPLPPGVRVVDFGIRGLDLTYALLEGYDAVILVDAVQRGQSPGTLYVLEPVVPVDPAAAEPGLPQGHNLDPAAVLRLATEMGGRVDRLLIVGCEPTPLAEADDMAMGLSPPVQDAIPEAVAMVESLIEDLLTSSRSTLEAASCPI